MASAKYWVNVEVSGWQNGSGWTYSEGLDDFDSDRIVTAYEYILSDIETWANEISDENDLCIRVRVYPYDKRDEEHKIKSTSYWVSEVVREIGWEEET